MTLFSPTDRRAENPEKCKEVTGENTDFLQGGFLSEVDLEAVDLKHTVHSDSFQALSSFPHFVMFQNHLKMDSIHLFFSLI